MDPMTIGALLGLGKSFAVDIPRENADRKIQLAQIRTSPWTGLAPGKVREADTFNTALQGAMAGNIFDVGKQGNNLNKQLVESQIAKNKADSLRAAMAPNQPYSFGQMSAPRPGPWSLESLNTYYGGGI